jgi:thiamine-phosphate pyrophosphorylase
MSPDTPRLYLITPPVSDWAAFAPIFEATLETCEVACILLRAQASDDEGRQEIIRALAPLAQARGAACLIADDPRLAIQADADGVHIDATGEPLKFALSALRPGHIVGAGGLTTRDAAMMAGEAGVDYLMFGGPGLPEPHAGIVERVAWWAEIFNVPCVGYAEDLAGIADLVRAGADFIALGEAIFADPRGAPIALREAAGILAGTREAAA